ncbi:MAG: 2,3-bisphosphoglycerate-independent phosphoglycerate mutase [Berkelbacteria bacterium GW2011_GWA2_35_9]|uniref:2,3-bisphosphoglycerate-independent phosphoglycerate mutase n=1 Tax=Berkelbacteria bacterium GW2011_GWA2_35_9 TaxID=1618333 RepID=A0A0G0D4Q7_9BACT|nr:MAG: 2,3-bisphosphoglycerate-independent phosphoglycerate mutase [Berkelbacteria bacterium GW2011_GWA2_35_9]
MKKTALIILDGLGISPDKKGNAFLNAKTPGLNFMLKNCPSTLLQASGESVGLPWGEMGNSEVGHTNLGTGRVVLQDYPLISKSIENGSFYEKIVLKDMVNYVKKNKSNLHILGIGSDGGVHGHIDHILAGLELAKRNNLKNVYIHIFSDGRDSSPKALKKFLDKINNACQTLGVGKIATVVGRYYAMDRDKNWDRTKIAYDLITRLDGNKYPDYLTAIDSQYRKRKSDEFLEPCVLEGAEAVKNNDAIFMTNFRCDRAIQLAKAFTDDNFIGFKRVKISNLYFAGMVLYQENLKINPIFSPVDLNNPATNSLANPLGKIISEHRLSQARISETEKFAHVTYFFNAGEKKPFRGEKQILVPSLKISSYDKKPEMSITGVVTKILAEVASEKDFILINFANPDMVGHSGNLNAAIQAVEYVDEALIKVVNVMLARDYFVMITADHGNCEEMINAKTGEIDKEHSVSPVPFILVDQIKQIELEESNSSLIKLTKRQPIGLLADIAPTILEILEIKKPVEMTGQSLIGMI